MIFAVVVGMAWGADPLAVGLVGLAILGVAALALWAPGRRKLWQATEAALSFRVGTATTGQATAESTLAAATDRFDLVAVSTAKQGSCLDLTYRVRLRSGTSPAGLVAELNLLTGVENVELKRND